MSEGPMLPPIPSIGEVLTRKDNLIEKKYTVLKCTRRGCTGKRRREFMEGDYIFRKITAEPCEKCGNTEFIINEIYSQFERKTRKAT